MQLIRQRWKHLFFGYGPNNHRLIPCDDMRGTEFNSNNYLRDDVTDDGSEQNWVISSDYGDGSNDHYQGLLQSISDSSTPTVSADGPVTARI